MIFLREAVIVEGKFDRLRVEQVLDALIVETKGFRIFKDKEKRAYLKKLAAQRGLLILTDSDAAGFVIRNHLKSFIPEAQLKNAYIPKVSGKEKRKATASKEGLLGVEGMEALAIETAVRRAGALADTAPKGNFTQVDLYNAGLTGGENSREKRGALLAELGLPEYLTTRDLLKYMNRNPVEAQAALDKSLGGS